VLTVIPGVQGVTTPEELSKCDESAGHFPVSRPS
jgi:hypothetical protein